MTRQKSKPKIVSEQVREIVDRPFPTNILFEHRPGFTTDTAISSFLATHVSGELPTAGVEEEEEGGTVPLGRTDKLDLFIEEDAFQAILRQCLEAARGQLETMGLLVGQHFSNHGTPFVVIDRVVTAKVDATAVTVKFNRESLADLFTELDEVEYDYVIAGWYHSHPGYTSFMSSVDVDTQRRMFTSALSAAIVVDPVRLDWKAFRIVEDRCLEIPYAIVGRPTRKLAQARARQLFCQHCNSPVKLAPDEQGLYMCTKCGHQGEAIRFAEFRQVRRE